MQVISLFSGIGGGELAATWAGWDIVASCEINPFCQKILKYYWPNAYHHDDVHTLNYETIITNSRWDPTKPTIIIGGWPCQPFSAAGKRKGTEDDRHLWPQFARIVREIKPDYICGENVFGFTNWSGGLVFEQVLTEMEALSYEIWPVILPACGVNAPHRRDRVWFVAHATKSGKRELLSTGKRDNKEEIRGENSCGFICNEQNGVITNTNSGGHSRPVEIGRDCINAVGKGEFGTTADPDLNGQQRGDEPTPDHEGQFSVGMEEGYESATLQTDGFTSHPPIQGREERIEAGGSADSAKTGAGLDNRPERSGNGRDAADTDRQRCQWGMHKTRSEKAKGYVSPCNARDFQRPDWNNFPTQSPVCGRNDELSDRLDGITFSKWRNESIKAYGNAWVPVLAYQIFKAINEYEHHH